MNLNFKEMIKLIRPKQWIKNSFVFAAIVFSGNFGNMDLLKNNIITFVIFCLTSSCIYVLNDIIDIEKDRCHPEKKNRPLASGKVTKNQGVVLDILLLISVIVLGLTVDYKIFMISLAYIILNILYTFKLKNVVIIDVMVITLGFVLRVESGSVATNVVLSPWLILCTVLLSLFLALNKRKSEIKMLKDSSTKHRAILKDYSIEFIDNMLGIITPSIFIAYCLYTFNSVQSRTMMITIAFVLYGVFRYQYLMEKANIGSKPEDVFTKDIPFLINIILWGISILTIIYFKL
ncbi:decaprenyl-phosphate phosphoribosyltransferase [Haloimpatiens lingqiaonensis]|uniref:decaprenyl-phosphate phosphoribosyltransferase n=1 Tax=Haloimpatiens lingqiaonensis TaxID=1380675 RepID=UPI0010FF3771|nr:decaprenyl-phosphate phosphoribosyltransferase [Haloimpatiens lingqiaonensis]